MLLRRNDPSLMERENRQHGNQEGCKETREESRKEEKAVTILQTEYNGDAQASPNLLCGVFPAAHPASPSVGLGDFTSRRRHNHFHLRTNSAVGAPIAVSPHLGGKLPSRNEIGRAHV